MIRFRHIGIDKNAASIFFLFMTDTDVDSLFFLFKLTALFFVRETELKFSNVKFIFTHKNNKYGILSSTYLIISDQVLLFNKNQGKRGRKSQTEILAWLSYPLIFFALYISEDSNNWFIFSDWDLQIIAMWFKSEQLKYVVNLLFVLLNRKQNVKYVIIIGKEKRDTLSDQEFL